MLRKRFSGSGRGLSTVALAAAVLLATWMGVASGGYFVGDWAPVAIVLAGLMLVLSVTVGVDGGARSWYGVVAVGLFALNVVWTFASLLWSPNRGDAWLGAGQTMVYLVAFWVALGLIGLGASRRWVLAASALGPAVVAAFTLSRLVPRVGDLFDNDRLIGTVGYFNGEAAFLLAPFWVAIYLAGSRRVHPVLRGLVLAGAVLCVQIAVLAQSRGALVAMAVSLLVFFALSGARVRGFLALIPAAAALLLSFSELNGVYLAFLNGEDAVAALERAIPIVGLTTLMAGGYGLLWGLLDRLWEPPALAAQAFGGAALAAVAAVMVLGAVTFERQAGDPVVWAEQKWEAFKNNDSAGQEQSRYLSASGSGRFTLWRVAWEDFEANPLFGVGTHNYEATYYQTREQVVGYVRQPHILPLEVLGERGIVGGVLFFGFLAVCLAAGLRQRFGRLNADGKAQVGAMVAAVTYWFVHSSAEWFWQMPAVTLPAMVYLAALVAPWRRTGTTRPGWIPRAAVATVAVMAAALVAPLYFADRYLEQSYATENPWVALENVELAQRLNPVDPRLFQREAELAMGIGDWPRVRQAYGEAIRLNPEHYAPYTLLARFYESGGATEEALALYQRARTLNPLDEDLKGSVERLEDEPGETP